MYAVLRDDDSLTRCRKTAQKREKEAQRSFARIETEAELF